MQPHPYPSEEGSSMLEFAFSAIIVFVLLFGSIGVAMAFYTYEVVNQYARDASRYAIVHGADCSIPPTYTTSCSIGTGGSGNTAPANVALKTYLNHQIFPGINGANLTVRTTYAKAPGAGQCTTYPATDCNGPGDQVTVIVSYPYLYKIPFIPQRSFTMEASSTMIISQ
jgi:Flp pilus assembly protein TadG